MVIHDGFEENIDEISFNFLAAGRGTQRLKALVSTPAGYVWRLVKRTWVRSLHVPATPLSNYVRQDSGWKLDRDALRLASSKPLNDPWVFRDRMSR